MSHHFLKMSQNTFLKQIGFNIYKSEMKVVKNNTGPDKLPAPLVTEAA